MLVLWWRTGGGLLLRIKLSHSSPPKSRADKTELDLTRTWMLEQKQNAVGLYCFRLTVTYLMLASKSPKQNSGDLIHHVDQVLFLNYPSFRLKEWDYFLLYWKTFLFPVYSLLLFSVLSKKGWTISRKNKKKGKTNPNGWLSLYL